MRKPRAAAILVLALILSASGSAAGRDPDQYVAFGDSITWGGGFYGYPPRLETLLTEKYGFARVWNAGVGGEGTSEGLARIDFILSGTSSKFLLLMEGTNDAANLLVSIGTAAANLREMCRRALAAGWTPLLATITPRSDWIWSEPNYRARYDDLNERIRQIASDLGITLVDAFEAFMAYPASQGGYAALLGDGVHPNSLGYQVLAEAWFAGLKAVKFDPPLPPLLPALETKLDANETRKLNTLTWAANPGNALRALKGYVIYRKPAGGTDAEFARIGSTSAAVFRYEDGALAIPPRFAYRVTALSSVSDESEPSASVSETAVFVFPPLSPAVRTIPGRPVRNGRKVNVVTFEPNPLNDVGVVAGYRVYRKPEGEPDAAFAAVATLGPRTLRVADPFLPAAARYVYAVTALSADGRESKKSAPVQAR